MFVGIIILIVGIYCLLTALNPSLALNFSYIWPLALIVISTYYIIKDRKLELANTIILYLGIWFFLVNINFIKAPYTKAFFPIILIIIGLYIIFGSSKTKKIVQKKEGKTQDYYGVFGETSESITSFKFNNVNIYSIFGSVKLNLKELVLKKNSTLTVYSIFGGTTLAVSDDYKLDINTISFIGGVDNKLRKEPDKSVKGKKMLTINCISIFGGTEII